MDLVEIKFRSGTAADTDEIMQLIRSAVKHMDETGISQWDEIYPARSDIEADIAAETLFVGTVDGRIAVIYVLNHQYDDGYKNGAWRQPDVPYIVLHRLCVSPDFQNMGIAARTLSQLEAQARKSGYGAVRLDAFTRNPYALRLYEKDGFLAVGTAMFRKGEFYLMEKYL